MFFKLKPMKKLCSFILLIFMFLGFIPVNTFATEEWSTKASMPTGRYDLTTAVVNDKIYAIWGSGDSTKVEEYDPVTNTWSTKASMPTARYDLSSAVVNGKIYVIWWKMSSQMTTVEEYNPITNTWTSKASMPTARYDLSSIAVNGKIYAIWGSSGGSQVTAVEEYDPVTNTWTTKASMPTATGGAWIWVINDEIYIVWGHIPRNTSGSIVVYNPVTNTWSTKTSLLFKRDHLTASVVNGKIYAIWWSTGWNTPTHEYDPVTDTWTVLAPLPTGRMKLSSAVVNNKIYVIGWYGATTKVEELILNNAPTISSLTSSENYINSSNVSNLPLSINWITEIDSWDNLSLKYSFDNVNYSNIDDYNIKTTFKAWEDISIWDIVNNWTKTSWLISNTTTNLHRHNRDWIRLWQTFTTPVTGGNVIWKSITIKTLREINWPSNLVLKLRDSTRKTNLLSSYSIWAPPIWEFNWDFDDVVLEGWKQYFFEIGGAWFNGFDFHVNDWDVYSWWNLYVSGLSYPLWDLYFKFEYDIDNSTTLYKTDATNSEKISYLWVATNNATIGGDVIFESAWKTSQFSWLSNGSTYYISNVPWKVSVNPWTYNKEFGVASWTDSIIMTDSYFNNSVWSFNLDASWEADWNKTIYIKANDWKIDSNIAILNIIKDTTAPVLSETTGIASLTNDNTPTYVLNSTETWSIVYSWDCSSVTTSVVPGDNNITFNTLADWVHNNCTIKATDVAWNESLTFSIPEFEIDTEAPVDPTSVTYNLWATASQTRDITVWITHSEESDVDAWCILDSTLNISTCSWGIKPTSYTFSSDWTKTTNIYLRDLAWNINTYSPSNTILIDTIDPLITIIDDVDATYTNTWKKVKATVVDANLQGFVYKIVDNSVTCDANVTYLTSYTSGNDIILDNELYNWKKICFSAFDEAWRVTYNESSEIENIDMSNPEEPNFSSVYQSAWNKIKFKWTCTPETGLQFVVFDNGVEVWREALSNPCNIDFEYTLSDVTDAHNIEYYLEDVATNKSLRKGIIAYVDSKGVLITPKSWKTIEPIVTFFGFAQPNTSVKIEDTVNGRYIATGITDNNGVFYIQTTTSQALWNLTIDLEVNNVSKNEPRTVKVATSSIIIPTIDEASVYSTYSWVKEIHSFESQLISFTAKGEPLSKFKVYSYADVWGNRVITEISEWQFSAWWQALVSSNVALPGWENELVIIDTIHEVSSNIVYMVIADPFGTVYDSITKQPLVWAEVTFCKAGENTPAVLPLLHGEEQPNPVITDSNWNYFSYETVWEKYYICGAVKDWYTFPSITVSSWNNNLDWSPNRWSHGQVFEILPTPLHIDVPMDRLVVIQETEESGWSWGWVNTSFYGILKAKKIERNYSTVWDRQLMVLSQAWTETKDKTTYTKFNWWVYSNNIYRVLYEEWRGQLKEWIRVTKPLIVQITDLNLNNFKVFIKTKEDQEYKLFTDYVQNGQTISFKTSVWFELYIENNVEVEDYKTNEELAKELATIDNRYKVKFYPVTDIKGYLIYINELDRKYWYKISRIPDERVISHFPTIFEKIESIEESKVPNKYKYIYNYFGWIYNNRYNNSMASK